MDWLDEARQYYDEPHRHYHTWEHVEKCLIHLSTVADHVSIYDYLNLRAALVYHDAIYDTEAKDNEERSAQVALWDLAGHGMKASDLKAVGRLILLTKDHDPKPDDEVGQVMCDIDLAILGAPPAAYSNYSQAVRREYSWVTDSAWRIGRAKVLASFLERPRIFNSPYFSHFEQQARANLTDELLELRNNG